MKVQRMLIFVSSLNDLLCKTYQRYTDHRIESFFKKKVLYVMPKADY